MRQPSLPEIITAGLDARLDGVHVAIPGTVVKYYPNSHSGTGTASADIASGVKVPLRDAAGEIVYETLPTFPDVPINWPSGGGYFVAFPLDEGDPVQMIFNDIGIAEFLTNGVLSEPLDTRRHSLGYPTAMPGGARPDKKALKDSPIDGAIIGKDDAQTQIKITGEEIQIGKGASDFVALSTLVNARIETLRLAINALATAAGAPAPPTLTIALASVAATLAKAK